MARNRVLSFILGSRDSATTTETKLSKSPKNPSQAPSADNRTESPAETFPRLESSSAQYPSPPRSASPSGLENDLPPNNHQARKRSSSRPISIIQAYQAPHMAINEDTIPELQPVFTFLNSHGNKLYQEGYFLKLDDQNTQGRPNPDRTWVECFAQLVGTVLSLWDAAELDAAGEGGEVLPKFINLTDASIKMIHSLPTRSNDEQPLQNILSISTAGRNRYLLHFNSHDALVQWSASIRLAMYEHATLQEAYTGALIAGKGKTLNNINVIMERMRFRSEAWVRVRFGAGVPWRRCWCVINPPDEKEFQKLQKEMKKRSPYDRSSVPSLKGDIRFYDSKKEGNKKQKKSRPIATITDAHSAYAIYPQSKALINGSTLLKIEGTISIHTDPPSSTEGFVFVMPETNPAVDGFEMLLRFLFPTWDTFSLYGRPKRLVASTLDPKSLMFAMPKNRRYGYLDVMDVANLITADDSGNWSEQDWRRRMKELSGQKMNSIDETESVHHRTGSNRSRRLSHGAGTNGNGHPEPRVGFAGGAAPVHQPASHAHNQGPHQNGAPGTGAGEPGMRGLSHGHAGNSPNPQAGPAPPHHSAASAAMDMPYNGSPPASYGRDPGYGGLRPGTETPNSDEDRAARDLEAMRQLQTPEPVSRPPAFSHGPGSRPGAKAYHSSELRRANSRLSQSTLSHIAKAGGVPVPAPDHLSEPFQGNGERRGHYPHPVPIHPSTSPVGVTANHNDSREVLNPAVTFPADRAGPNRSNSPGYRDPSRTAPGAQMSDAVPRSSDEKQSTTSEERLASPGQNSSIAPQRPYMGSYRPSTPPSRGQSPSPLNQQQGAPRSGAPHGPSGLQNETLTGPTTSPARKPLPSHSQVRQGAVSPETASSASSFGGQVIDQAILDQIRVDEDDDSNIPEYYRQDSLSSTSSSYYTGGTRGYNPQQQGPSGRYHNDRRRPAEANAMRSFHRQGHQSDADSTASPDYASTHRSSETHASAERPRAGVLRTVGGAESPVVPARDFDIPDVDFGPTMGHNVQAGAKQASPPPGQRRPPFSHVNRSPPTPQQARHTRQESDDTVRRSIMWQPAVASGGPGGQGASVEDFVQQRAAAAAAPRVSHSRGSSFNALGSTTPTPAMSHARTPSGNTLGPGRSMTPTPAMTRTPSHDMLKSRHSRSSSADLLRRPGSRGANLVLDAGSAGEVSSHLSARELEHVARVTGTPLINVAGNRSSQQLQQGPGLVGAIDAREKERQQVKVGLGSQAVQNAIDQRGRQMYQMQQQQQQQQQAIFHQQQQQALYHANMQQGQMRFPPQQGHDAGGNYGHRPVPGGHPQQGYHPRSPGMDNFAMRSQSPGHPYGTGPPQQQQWGHPRSPGPRGPPPRGQSPGIPYGMGSPLHQQGHPQGGRGPPHQGNAF